MNLALVDTGHYNFLTRNDRTTDICSSATHFEEFLSKVVDKNIPHLSIMYKFIDL